MHWGQTTGQGKFYRSDTYRTVSEDNCEITSGIEPVKLLYDRFLQHGICTGHGRFNVLQRSSRNHFVGTEQIENWSTHTNIGRPWDLQRKMICPRSDHWRICSCKYLTIQYYISFDGVIVHFWWKIWKKKKKATGWHFNKFLNNRKTSLVWSRRPSSCTNWPSQSPTMAFRRFLCRLLSVDFFICFFFIFPVAALYMWVYVLCSASL